MAWPGFRQWVSGIQGQLVLGLLGVIVFITLVSTMVSTYLHERFFSDWLDTNARERIVGLARAVAPFLGDDPSEAAQDTIRALLEGDVAHTVAVFDAQGRTRFLAPTGAAVGDAPGLDAVADGVTRRAMVAPDGRHVWRYLAPVAGADGGAEGGVLLVDLELSILAHARSRNLLIHGAMLVVLVLAGLAISLLAARRIAAPILQLARHAQAVSVSIPTTPVPAVGAREVRSLARALNRMLRSLRHSMARLRESEARYRGLFDRMPDVALELDGDGRVLAVNAAVEQLGWSVEDVTGGPVRVLVVDADARRVTSAVSHAVRTGALTTTSVQLRSADGTPRYGELRAALRDRGKVADAAGGESPRLVAILRDVTERKRADDDVAHAQRVLSIHTLASGIAHEFNNVMATIIGTGALLASRPDLPEEVSRELSRITEMARRGADLSAQVLSYTRRTSEEATTSSIDDVIGETMDLLSRTLDKRVEILVDTASSLPRVKGDPTRLQQVLLNLGINAGDAMPDGGTLTFEARATAITHKADADRWDVAKGDYVHVTVRDTGAGMDRATVSRVFEPYFTTKQPGEGTGLGLSVVYGAVRGLGGGIDVESAPGDGATFHLLLPVAAEEAAVEVTRRRRKPTREQLAAATGQTILVVEDEPDLRDLSRRVLERRGYHIHSAADGFEAEALMREHGPDIDLVLLDVNLPRRDGAATYDILRELRPDLPVVIVSAGGVTDHRISDLLRRGALTLLRKPYEFEELEDVVVQALTGGDTGETAVVG